MQQKIGLVCNKSHVLYATKHRHGLLQPKIGMACCIPLSLLFFNTPLLLVAIAKYAAYGRCNKYGYGRCNKYAACGRCNKYAACGAPLLHRPFVRCNMVFTIRGTYHCSGPCNIYFAHSALLGTLHSTSHTALCTLRSTSHTAL